MVVCGGINASSPSCPPSRALGKPVTLIIPPRIAIAWIRPPVGVRPRPQLRMFHGRQVEIFDNAFSKRGSRKWNPSSPRHPYNGDAGTTLCVTFASRVGSEPRPRAFRGACIRDRALRPGGAIARSFLRLAVRARDPKLYCPSICFAHFQSSLLTDSTIAPPLRKKRRFSLNNVSWLLDTRKDAMKKCIVIHFLVRKVL